MIPTADTMYNFSESRTSAGSEARILWTLFALFTFWGRRGRGARAG